MKSGVSPAVADTLINGVKVFTYRRANGSEYESEHDFSRFGVQWISMRRRPLTEADFR